MKAINTFKKIITVYFFLLAAGNAVLFVLLPILFAQGKFTTLEHFDGFDISSLSMGRFLSMLLVAAFLQFQYIKAIYFLKNSLTDLSTGNYFSELVINNFKKVGNSFLICGIGFWAFKIVVRIALMSDIKIGIDHALVLLTIIGLFFLFLSEVFAKARKTEQENKLTI